MATEQHVHEHHHHHEGEEDNYYLDQLCMVTLSAAFGGVCLAMYFVNRKMLNDMLGTQFHPFVLWSGLILVFLALVRAFGLWSEGARANTAHTHDHGNHNDACCDHGHDHTHEHDHSHEHAHAGAGHHHHHDHGPEDHDHSWAPWRYVVLLVPILFFLLGLPSKGLQVEAADAEFTKDTTKDAKDQAIEVVGLVAPNPISWSQVVYAGYLARDQVGKEVEDWDFRALWEVVRGAALSPDDNVREGWKNKAIRVIGQYSPSLQSNREFRLVRFKITCCSNDAYPLPLPIVSREAISDIKPNTWVRVTGRVEFRKRRDEVVPIIVVTGPQAVKATPPDPNPYIQ